MPKGIQVANLLREVLKVLEVTGTHAAVRIHGVLVKLRTLTRDTLQALSATKDVFSFDWR